MMECSINLSNDKAEEKKYIGRFPCEKRIEFNVSISNHLVQPNYRLSLAQISKETNFAKILIRDGP